MGNKKPSALRPLDWKFIVRALRQYGEVTYTCDHWTELLTVLSRFRRRGYSSFLVYRDEESSREWNLVIHDNDELPRGIRWSSPEPKLSLPEAEFSVEVAEPLK
jgi:hypothetical protein